MAALHRPHAPSPRLRPLLGLLSLLAACGAPEPERPDGAPDASERVDALPQDDASTIDDNATDDRPPTTDRTDSTALPNDAAPTEGPCAASRLIDLDARGTRVGAMTTYTGTNAMAPAVSPVIGTCGGRPGHVVAFRYTVRVRSRLIVSTFHQGTAASFDTVVWAQSTCAAMDPGIGCNDDVAEPYDLRGSPATGRFHSFFTTTEPTGGHADHTLDAGATVYVFVGSYTPASGPTPTGTFQLTVTEAATPASLGAACDPSLDDSGSAAGAGCPADAACRASGTDHSGFVCVAPVPAGGTCDPARAMNVCASGTYCHYVASAYRCAVVGVAGGPCRSTTPRCDAGLACNSAYSCAPEVTTGAMCDPRSASNVCVSGTSCATVAGASRCVPEGALGARCRTTGSPCDAGLTCSDYLCVTALPAGSPCGVSGSRAICADGTCVTQAGASRCVANGGPGARCRAATPQCDAGFACGYGGSCVPEVPAGAECDGTGGRSITNLCVSGTSCQRVMGAWRCVVQGIAGNPCRATSPACDAGLACGGSGCVPEVARDGACDPRYVANYCVAGTSCLTVEGASRCVVDGANGNRCRSTGPRCDAGLACAGDSCRPAVPVGATCDPSGATNACEGSATCRTVLGVSRCAAERGLHGRCGAVSSCSAGTVCGLCDVGLMCSNAYTCAPEVPVGAACDPARTLNVCTTGATCVTTLGASRCVVDGAREGRCRMGRFACGAGLGCNTSAFCVSGIPLGAKCDPTGTLGVCVSGSTCRRTQDASRCLADGTRGARCRESGSRCDAGLTCNINGVCLPGVPIGGACDPSWVASVCSAGASCATAMGESRCVANGLRGGRCRDSVPSCDAGLGCDNRYVCVAAVPMGGPCDPTRATNVCVVGASCGAVMGAPRCVADGALGGACRWPGPRCDAGLSCGRSRCVPEAPIGAACDPDGLVNACGSDAHCVTTAGASRCVANGTQGGYCRTTAPICDVGMACGEGFTCRPAIAIGATCDPAGVTNACAPGGSCQPVMGVSRCVADGLRDANCRASAPLCDPGLTCAPMAASPFPRRACLSGIPHGGSCDPSQPATSRCVDGAVCRGADTTGLCTPVSYTRAPATVAFVDACAEAGATTLLMSGGDTAETTELPFGFNYFGNPLARGTPLTVSARGWLRFGATGALDLPSDTLPVLRPDNAIFALWTYLELSDTTPTPGRVCVATTGAAPARVYVVEWQNAEHYLSSGDALTMEVQLHEGTNAIDVLYRALPRSLTDGVGGVTVGLQGPGGTSVVQVCGGTSSAPTACTRAMLTDTRYTPTR
jgi:hypothetical protein